MLKQEKLIKKEVKKIQRQHYHKVLILKQKSSLNWFISPFSSEKLKMNTE